MATPLEMIGELASTAAATVATMALTTASGGELIDTMVPIDMPAQRMICAAAIGTRKPSSCTVWPNHVHSSPLTAT